MTQSIGIPVSEYDMIIATEACTATARAALERFVQKTGYRRIMLFGTSITGQAVREVLGERFAGFVDSSTLAEVKSDAGDCLLFCTSPVHLKEVEKSVRTSSLSGLPQYQLFSEKGLNIRLILETQPRCGTGYVLANLRQSLGLGYASVFRVAGNHTTPDDLIRYIPEKCNGYVVKAHFTKTLHYPQYRYVPKLFLTGYFHDTYYRWARMLSDVAPERREQYYLSAESPEWKRVKGYIPLHQQWLEYIKSRNFIRYEDFFSNFDGVMDTFEQILGERPQGFESPQWIASRIYWSGDQAALMDNEVNETLDRAFSNKIKTYYPEKA